ncbi:MAG: hypothetical protein MO853_07545 [Candidatus Protistobacter heckmanni]|nr:hypothetical protein [Candidatus Protistobacter heckmanni]
MGNDQDNMADLGAGDGMFSGGRGRDALIVGRGHGGATFQDFDPREDMLLLDADLGVDSVEAVRRLAVAEDGGIRIVFAQGDWVSLPSVVDVRDLDVNCLRVGWGLARCAAP